MEHGFSKFLARSITNLINIDYLKPAEVEESYHTVFARGFTLTPDFSSIRLSRPGSCIDQAESLAERQGRSPHYS
jgi:hypothetical protein